MTVRRTRLQLGVLAVVAAVTALWISLPWEHARSPLHFWVLVAENPHRPYSAPSGGVIDGWEVVHEETVPSGVVRIVLAPKEWTLDWLLTRVGLRSNPTAKIAAYSWTPGKDGWREFVAASGPWPSDAVVDPALVGEWSDSVGVRWTLGSDGTCPPGPFGDPTRWGRQGQLILIGGQPRGSAEWSVSNAVLLDADGHSFSRYDRVGWKVR